MRRLIQEVLSAHTAHELGASWLVYCLMSMPSVLRDEMGSRELVYLQLLDPDS